MSLSIVSPIKRVIGSKTFETDPGFKVIFKAPEFEMGIGELSTQVMDAGWGRVTGLVREDGVAELNLDALGVGAKKVFELPEDYNELSGITFDIAIIFRNKEYLRDSKTLNMQIVDEIFDYYGGVRVYLEGFRVYPYGEPGDDWLDIEKDVARRLRPVSEVFERLARSLVGVELSTGLLKHPSSRNLLGGVQINNKPKAFQVALSREGFVENIAFEKLRMVIRRALEWATLYYTSFVEKFEAKKLKETIENFEEIKAQQTIDKFGEIKENERKKDKRIFKPTKHDIIDSAINVMSEVTEETIEAFPDKKKEEILKYTNSALRVIDDSVSQMQREINFLRLVASQGSLMWTLIHESRVLVARLDTIANSLENLATELKDNDKLDIEKIILSLRKTSDRFDRQFNLLNKIGAGVNLTERAKIPLLEITNEVVECYATLIDDFHLKIDFDIPSALKVGPMFEVELYSVTVNLLSNAIKAVIAGDGEKIRIEALQNAEGTLFRVYNDGCIEVPEEIKDLATEPFVSDRDGILYKKLKEKLAYDQLSIVGQGSGMGLNIVKNILSQYGKRFQFIDVESPWRTCAEVSLP